MVDEFLLQYYKKSLSVIFFSHLQNLQGIFHLNDNPPIRFVALHQLIDRI